MKSLPFILGLGAILVLGNPSVKAAVKPEHSQNQPSETREVRNFHSISSSGAFDVRVTMGDEESLKIEASDEDLSQIETFVQNGALKIRMKRTFSNLGLSAQPKAVIYVTAKRLDGLMQSGSGSITLNGVLNSPSADIQLSGSGSITTGIDTQTAGVALSGSGNISLNGKTGTISISISGSGDVNADSTQCDSANIKVAGSGDVYLAVKNELNAVILGTGLVKYTGEPKLSVSKIGPGDVEKM